MVTASQSEARFENSCWLKSNFNMGDFSLKAKQATVVYFTDEEVTPWLDKLPLNYSLD